MIIFLIAISYLLGLNAFHIAIPLFIIISFAIIIFIVIRLRKKSIIPICVFLTSIAFAAIYNFATPTRESYLGFVVDSSENYYLFQSGVHRFYVYEKDNDKQFGDILLIKDKPGELDFVTYESQFDFKEYLNNKGVKYSLSSYKVETKFALPLRTKVLRDRFLDHFDDDTKFLIDAFLFNNRDYNSSVISNASMLNLIFLFSMSGIYFSLLLKGVAKVIGWIFKKEIISDCLALIVFLPIFIFIFPKISIIRVTLVYVFRVINKHVLKNRFASIHLNSLAMIIMLIFNHAYAFQMGFYLGFFISFFIYFTGEITSRFHKKYYAWILRLLIFVFMFPISSYMQGSFHPLAFIYQVVLIPMNLVFIGVSLLSFYITPFPFLNAFGFIYNKSFDILSKIDISLVMGDFGPYFVFLYYVLLIAFLYFYENHRPNTMFIISAIMSALLIVSFLPIRNVLVNAIYFINVGQGDSILIQNKKHAVLIDTGGNQKFDMATKTLIPFFRKKQIYQLDALIITHSDFDHSGAATSLRNNFKVNNFLYNSSQFPYQVGDLYFDNINTISAKDENDTSLVFNLDFMNQKWLLMGDASKTVEKFLIDSNYDIDCDVIKVGHHGSKTSSSDDFIRLSTPKEAIISCGKNNIYKHPNKEVLDILNKYNVAIRRTDYEGTIAYQSYSL